MKLLVSFLFALIVNAAMAAAPSGADWSQPFPPFKIADNLYYVGTRGLANYLITTPEGHILINSDLEENVPMIRQSVEQLGFKFTDIKILLGSHAHSDHVEGHGHIKELTKARVEVMRGDDQVIASGGKGQYLYREGWRPCSVDRVLKDGDTVTLGEATMTARHTPGHTRGCTTWTMQVTDGGKPLNVVIIGSPNVNPGYQLITNRDYPEIADDFAKTFRLLRALPCDIFLGAHGNYYGMEAKVARLQKDPKSNPFIDPEGYRAYVENRYQAFREKAQPK
ncbi:MAG: subclass B3 metallo-beta-lactamase [Verrucomicrobia bacterium]|nr:subclass B3 metallo-beta-lactamase [Verrucomicrobiota bacterium]